MMILSEELIKQCYVLIVYLVMQILKLYLAYFKFLRYFVISYCLIEIYVIIYIINMNVFRMRPLVIM